MPDVMTMDKPGSRTPGQGYGTLPAKTSSRGPEAREGGSGGPGAISDRLVTFFRSAKMTSKERDLVSQADEVLSSLFGGKMSEEERVTLETWLSGKLEQERQGWKQKLQLSMKEIEKQRKLAMEAHSTVEEINERVERMFSPVLAIYREPSIYQPDDRALNMADRDNLTRNLDTIQQTLQALERERVELREHFQIPEEQTVPEYFSRLREGLGGELEGARAEARDTEERLRREIDNLNDAFQLHENISKTEKEGFNQEILEQKQEIEDLREIVRRQKTRYRMGAPTRQESRGVQARVFPAQRECCIQVDIPAPGLPERGVADGTAAQQEQGVQADSRTADADCKDRTRAAATRRSLQSIDTTHTDSSKSIDTTRSKHTEDKSRETPFLPRDKKLSYFSDSNYSILHVRNQVVTLANKLEKAKWDMEAYEKQLAWMKLQPKNNSHDYSVRRSLPRNGNEADASRKWVTSDGFLAGNGNKNNKNKAVRELEDIRERKKGKGRAFLADDASKSSGSSLGMRCLRCDKPYTSRDNGKLACRYHPKGKQKIEKYDSSGKLQKVSVIWECCMQRETCAGCSVGEHI